MRIKMHFLNLSQFFNEMKRNEEESFLSSVKCRIRTVVLWSSLLSPLNSQMYFSKVYSGQVPAGMVRTLHSCSGALSPRQLFLHSCSGALWPRQLFLFKTKLIIWGRVAVSKSLKILAMPRRGVREGSDHAKIFEDLTAGVNKKPKQLKTVWHEFEEFLKLSGRLSPVH